MLSNNSDREDYRDDHRDIDTDESDDDGAI